MLVLVVLVVVAVRVTGRRNVICYLSPTRAGRAPAAATTALLSATSATAARRPSPAAAAAVEAEEAAAAVMTGTYAVYLLAPPTPTVMNFDSVMNDATVSVMICVWNTAVMYAGQ